MPSYEELKRAARHNPDGFGFVSSNGLYWRGMDFERFYQMLQRVGINDSCIMHLRIATHGSIKTSNCHPFYYNGIYFAHNGILYNTRVYGDVTDSETEFRTILEPAISDWGIDSPQFQRLVARRIGYSKFAFMIGGEIRLFGNWINDKGLMWSNLNHRPIYEMSYTPKLARV